MKTVFHIAIFVFFRKIISQIVLCNVLLFFFFGYSIETKAQYSGNYNVGPAASGGVYDNLTLAFAAISSGTVTGNVNLILVTGYPAVAETYPIVPSTNNGSFTITIYPGVSGLSITSANATGTLNLNGCDNYIFDGRVGASGSTKDLIIENTNAGGYAIQFINDASNNIIKYSKVNGRATSNFNGVIFFSTGTTTGNDNNTIDNCDVNASSLCAVGIESLGSASPADNSGNIIQNNAIFDFYSSSYLNVLGIYIASGNTDWTITGNSLFQTAVRTPAMDARCWPIYISSPTGSNFVVSENYIGGSSVNCGNSPLSFGSAAYENLFYAITISVSSASACFVQDNIISNIEFNSECNTASTYSFIGIDASAGYVNVDGNTMGETTGTGSISITYSSASSQGFVAGGIYSTASQGNISNNNVGSITISGGNTSRTGTIYALDCHGALSSDFIINGNIIGSETTANSIQYLSSTVPVTMMGIWLGTTGASYSVNIASNTLQNIVNNSTGTSANYGIYIASTSTTLNRVSNNTIANLTLLAPVTSGLIGINFLSTTAGQTILNNVIHDLTNTDGTLAVDNKGIYYSGPTAGANLISGNAIYNLNLSSTSTSAAIYGIQIASGIATTSNNMIALGNGLATGYLIYGIYQTSATAATNNYFFNSVYIGGIVTGGSSTSCYYSTVTRTRIIQNNIFYNNRSGGGIRQYSIYVSSTSNLTSNYNDFLSTSGWVGRIGATNYATLLDWRTGSSQDANSVNVNPSFVAPTAVTPDLHISSGSLVISLGMNGTGVASDFDNDLRSSTPDIGADEYHTNYYSKSSGNLELTTSWGINTDGSGINPPNFTTRNCTFNIRNNPSPTIGAAWTVNATVGNIVILGDGINPCNFTIPSAYSFIGTINVSKDGTLTNQNTTNPTLNILDAASTINYNSANGVNQTVVSGVNYGNLIISNSTGSGSSTKTLAANITGIAGNLTINDYATFDLATFKANRIGGGGILTLADNSTLRLSGNSGGASANNNFPNNFSTMTVSSSNTVEYYGATQTIYSIPTYGNLTTTTAGTKTAGGNLTITGNVFINTGTFAGSTFTINLAGNWTNNLAYTFATSTVNFNGSVAQTIGGTIATTFYKLTINNTFATADQITLNANITVNNTLTLSDGIINPNGKTFLLAAGSTTSLGSANSYVDGPLSFNLASSTATTLNFPVGKGVSWNPFELTPKHTNATSVTYTGEVINSSAVDLGYLPLPSTIDHVSYERYWQIDRQVVANLTNATVKLYYNSTDGVTDCNNLTVAKTTGSGAPWIDIGGSGLCDGFGNPSGSLTSGLFTSFSKFSLANKTGGTNPLPIELLSFTAEYNYGNVDLDWKTSSETNNDYFTIEKSKDANIFSTVTTVKGAGNSHSLLNYSAIDKEPYNGLSYYRLRQTDFDGKFTLSNLVPINITKPFGSFSFEVFPNPISKEENPSINVSSFEPQTEILVVVRNLLGQELYSKVIMTDFSGNSITAIDIENKLPAGTYLIIGTSLNQTFNKYLIIK